jgi:superfamily II DNA or RNA helicase
MLILESPTRLRVEGHDNRIQDVEKFLTYTNKAKLFEVARMKKNRWFAEKHGEEKWKEEIDRLKSEATVCLLKTDQRGFWTYPGLAKALSDRFGDSVINNVSYPEPGLFPWDRVPSGKDRYYQELMHDRLIEARHASVQVGTGLGKSRVIRNVVKTLGLKTVVLAPSLSIAEQLYDDFVHHFGAKRVGFYGDGKKKADKLITVGLYQSLARIEPGSADWLELQKTEVFIVDESHLTPAATLKQVCEGLCGNAPYRFFFSGTQMRNDGADLLLQGIIGPIVYEMTVKQGVEEGFLSRPNFIVRDFVSPSSYVGSDPDAMLEKHFYANKAMYKDAAEIANKSVDVLGHQVLILLKEVNQFPHLYPFLRHEPGFAHGGISDKKNKATVPPQFHKSDVKSLVKDLNDGNRSILVGTSCISIGTDIRTPKTIINLQGGISEPVIRQAVGRGTRLIEGVKTEFNYFDYMVKVASADAEFLSITERHAKERIRIYRDIYDNVRIIK